MLGRLEHLFLLFLVCIPIAICGQVDTISVFFETDKATLETVQRLKIDSFLSANKMDSIQDIVLIGQADYRGSTTYNLELSQRRAHEVASYIVEFKPIFEKIIEHRGIGELDSRTDLSIDRRVDIICTRVSPRLRLDKSFTPSSIPVDRLSVGNVLKIKGLNFHPGRSVLLPQSIPHLKDLEKLLIEYPNLEIEIQGHVCCRDQQRNDQDGFNLDTQVSNLSTARAKNIYDYLIRMGIAGKRLQFKGFGATTPIVYPEESEKDRIQNRRVELLITKL